MRVATRRGLVVLAVQAVLAACGGASGGGGDGPVDAPPEPALDAPIDAPPGMVMGMVGEEGGSLGEPGGPQIDVPPGAVDEDTMITVMTTEAPAPADAVTPVYQFGPEGTVFAVPLKVRLPVPPGTSAASLYWTKPGSSTEFERIGGTVVGDTLEAEVTHFSGGYVGPSGGVRTLSGTAITSWASSSGIINEPTDFTTASVRALVPDGIGGYTAVDGVGTTAGTFSIAGLPDGPVTLQLGDHYYVTAAAAFDTGTVLPGRPGLVAATTPSLALNLTNLSPWQADDTLELLAPDASTWWFDEETLLTIPEGATTLTATISNQDAQDCCGYANLIDGTKGDKLFIGQLATRQTTDAAPVTYRALARVLEPAPFTQTPGGTTTIDGALEDVTAASTFSVDVDAPAFDAVAGFTDEAGYPTALGPNEASAQMGIPGIYVDVQGIPGPAYLGTYTASVDYALIALSHAAPRTLATGLGFGELSGWTTSLLARAEWWVRYRLPGTSTPRRLLVGTGRTNLLPASGSQIVTPLLGPVRSPTIDGADLFASRGGVPLTAHVAWQAPALGTPTFYTVTFFHLHVVGDATTGAIEAVFTTTDTHVDAPPGALTPGAYAVTIAANTGDADAANKIAYGNDWSRVASAIIYVGVNPGVGTCDPLAQTGCGAGEKCTWIYDLDDPPVGHVGCAAVATSPKQIGEACTAPVPGATGYDDCVTGAACRDGECRSICDPNGGAPTCAAGSACTQAGDLFVVGGSPVAGVCEPG